MFDPQKAPPTQKSLAPEINIDPSLIPIRTMKGDMEAIEGRGKVIINPDSSDYASNNPEPSEGNLALFGKAEKPAASPFSDIAVSPFLFETKKSESENEPESKMVPEELPISGSRSVQMEDFFRPPVPEEAKEEEPEQFGGLKKVFLAVIGAIILLTAVGGAYYFYMTRYNVPKEEPAIIAPPAAEPPRENQVRTEKFSTARANSLKIDVESINASEARELFIKTIAEIKADGKTVPIEFMITDANSNPISFQVFSKVIGLTPSAKLLALLKDEFSVYLYSDIGKNRMAIAVEPDDPTTIMAALRGDEQSLVRSLGTLFLGENLSARVTFNDGSYAGIVVRYQNLNANNDLSVDYFLKGSRVYFATSKNLGRAIIDELNRKTAEKD